MDNIENRVLNILVEIKSDIKSHPNDNFMESGLLDSLDIMKLIIRIEDEFDIQIEPEDVLSENFESIASISDLVKRCKN